MLKRSLLVMGVGCLMLSKVVLAADIQLAQEERQDVADYFGLTAAGSAAVVDAINSVMAKTPDVGVLPSQPTYIGFKDGAFVVAYKLSKEQSGYVVKSKGRVAIVKIVKGEDGKMKVDMTGQAWNYRYDPAAKVRTGLTPSNATIRTQIDAGQLGIKPQLSSEDVAKQEKEVQKGIVAARKKVN